MNCGLCKEEVNPLDAHMGRINGTLDVFHIDCWNDYHRKGAEHETNIQT